MAVVLLMFVLTLATTGCFGGQEESRILEWAASISPAPSLLPLLYMPVTLAFTFLELNQLSLAPGPLHMPFHFS